MMLAPHTISEKIRMKEMVANTSDCVPEPLSPKVWEMIIAMTKLSTAANIFVPKVFRIFLNTGFYLCVLNDKSTEIVFRKQNMMEKAFVITINLRN